MMTRSIPARLLAATLLVATPGCSSEPESDDPVIINTESDTGGGNNTIEDAGRGTEDASPPDQGREEDAAGLPDLTEVDTRPADADPDPGGTVCQSKEAPVQLIHTCTFEWSSCADGVEYSFVCNVENVGGMAFSLCNCFEDGIKDEADKIVDICGRSDWSEVEAIVNEECGWDLR